MYAYRKDIFDDWKKDIWIHLWRYLYKIGINVVESADLKASYTRPDKTLGSALTDLYLFRFEVLMRFLFLARNSCHIAAI